MSRDATAGFHHLDEIDRLLTTTKAVRRRLDEHQNSAVQRGDAAWRDDSGTVF